ncbi:MAG: hypothetical protein M0036_01260 [Desulfobacteraceae bacterium]|nr:hypothetical protein [Desulfobacteraceae bacterium]
MTIFVHQMLRQRNVKFDDTVVQRINDMLGAPIPLFLQMLTQELYRQWKRNKSEALSAAVVDEVFNKSLLGEMARDKLQHYRSRIDLHYPTLEREAVCQILGNLSLSEKGLTHGALFQIYHRTESSRTGPRQGAALSQDFQRLLLHLQSDFYIEQQPDGTLDFTSRLLKIWWKKYYGYEYEGK